MHRKAMRWILILLVLCVVVALSVGAGAATLEVVPAASEARYRVREQLAGISFPTDAVGTTQDVRGTIALDGEGRPAPESQVTVDLRSLRSDEARLQRTARSRCSRRGR